MTSPAFELLARTVAEEVSGRPCAGCGRPLKDARVRVRPETEARIAAEVTCSACGERLAVGVEPEPGDGFPEIR